MLTLGSKIAISGKPPSLKSSLFTCVWEFVQFTGDFTSLIYTMVIAPCIRPLDIFVI